MIKYLIENTKTNEWFCTQYAQIDGGLRCSVGWTKDPNKAVKFDKYSHAELYLSNALSSPNNFFDGLDIAITEHIFIDKRNRQRR